MRERISYDDDMAFLIWSVGMFITGYVLGLLQQNSNILLGHETFGGMGVCLHIDKCPLYIYRSQCSTWLDS